MLDSVVPTVTVPTKIPLPVPSTTSSQPVSVAPESASTTEWNLDGVWSAVKPSVTTS